MTTPKVLINCSNLKVGGGLQVAHSFLEQLRDEDSGWHFVVTLSDALSRMVDPSGFPDSFRFFNYNIRPSWWKSLTGADSFLNRLAHEHSVDAAFSPFGPTYWRPKEVPHVAGFAKAQYLIRNKQFDDILGPLRRTLLSVKEVVHMFDFRRNNTCLVTENQTISNLLGKRLSGKTVHTVTNTCSQVYGAPESWDRSIDLPTFNGTTLLTISADYPHKNLQVLPDVARELVQRFPAFKFRFVLTLDEGVFDSDTISGVENQFLFLGPVTLHQCPWLYSQADLMILPTLLECFSASYAEAMVMGVPIATSDLPFAHGLCGNAADYFDPSSSRAIADVIHSLASDERRRGQLVAAGRQQLQQFDTPTSRAEKYIRILESELRRASS
ncbi:MAG: glycosyltransferase [Planctomycetota bacterium]